MHFSGGLVLGRDRVAFNLARFLELVMHFSTSERASGEERENASLLCAAVLVRARRIVPKNNTGRIRFTDHITGNGEALFQKLEALNLEGMVMKRKDSVYSPLQSRDWLKVRTSSGKTTIQKRIETWSYFMLGST